MLAAAPAPQVAIAGFARSSLGRTTRAVSSSTTDRFCDSLCRCALSVALGCPSSVGASRLLPAREGGFPGQGCWANEPSPAQMECNKAS
eukprot:462754-Alexandrium_andersonii.AAC.1